MKVEVPDTEKSLNFNYKDNWKRPNHINWSPSCWHVYWTRSDPSSKIHLHTETVATTVSCNWIYSHTLQPLIYFTLNFNTFTLNPFTLNLMRSIPVVVGQNNNNSIL